MILLDRTWQFCSGHYYLTPVLSWLPSTWSCCVTMCILSTDLWEYEAPHVSHLNGLSPVWVLMWLVTSCFWVKPRPQIVHLNGFSPVCILMCRDMLLFCAITLPHTLHLSPTSDSRGGEASWFVPLKSTGPFVSGEKGNEFEMPIFQGKSMSIDDLATFTSATKTHGSLFTSSQ